MSDPNNPFAMDDDIDAIVFTNRNSEVATESRLTDSQWDALNTAPPQDKPLPQRVADEDADVWVAPAAPPSAWSRVVAAAVRVSRPLVPVVFLAAVFGMMAAGLWWAAGWVTTGSP